MTGKWLNDNLYSIDEKVRVERGPQMIELECNDKNLSDKVTAPHYRIGKRDALGKIIMPEKIKVESERVAAEADPYGTVKDGEPMNVVDWRAKHVPHLWKIYQLQETGEVYAKDDPDGTFKKGDPIERFIKISEVEGKEGALASAQALFKEAKNAVH